MPRPAKKNSDLLDRRVQLYLTRAEYEDVQRLSERSGMPVAAFIRANLRAWLK